MTIINGMGGVTGLRYGARYTPVPNITPFTYRDGWTFLERIEHFIKWVNDEVLTKVNEIDDQLNEFINEEYSKVVQGLRDDVDTNIDGIADLYIKYEAIVNNSIVAQDPVVAQLVEADESETGVAVRKLIRDMTTLYHVDEYPGNTDDEKIANAIADLKTRGGGTIVFSGRTYSITEPILFDQTMNFKGVHANNYGGTVLDYSAGLAGTSLFQWDANGQPFFARCRFEDFMMTGDGVDVNDFGVTATVNGIMVDHVVSRISIHNVAAERFDTAFFLDGFGHHVQECVVRGTREAYAFYHPEQVMMLNNWATKCDLGVTFNRGDPRNGASSQIIGGAIQRCRIGIWLNDVSSVYVRTYCEGSTAGGPETDYDVLLGDPSHDAGDFSSTVRDSDITIFAASREVGVANFGLPHAENNVLAISQGGSGVPSPSFSVLRPSKGNELIVKRTGSASPFLYQDDVARSLNVERLVGRPIEAYSTRRITTDHINNTGTLSDVTGLTTYLMAGLYKFEGYFILSGSVDADAKLEVRPGAGSSIHYTSNSHPVDTTGAVGPVDRGDVTSGQIHVSTVSATEPTVALVSGLIHVTGNSVGVRVMASQSVETAGSALRMRAGSAITYHRIGDA